MLAIAPLEHQLGLFTKPDRWVDRWRVASSRPRRPAYVVARDATGAWGCSCRGWIYHRASCIHIRAVQLSLCPPTPIN